MLYLYAIETVIFKDLAHNIVLCHVPFFVEVLAWDTLIRHSSTSARNSFFQKRIRKLQRFPTPLRSVAKRCIR
jgi:hypothetical protein